MLEHRLWTTTTALEELAALLADLARPASAQSDALAAAAYRRRVTEARLHARALRAVIAANRPVDLAPAEPAGGDPDAPTPPGGPEPTAGEPGAS